MSAQRERISDYQWLHDDTEEDLVGADWHQDAIRATVYSLRDLASERHLPWHVGDQLTLVGTRPDGTEWRPSPDVMVHLEAGVEHRKEMVVRVDGPPALIVEVVSPSTWAYDVDTRRGKAFGYLHLGVPDYLVFDPHADLLGAPCRGWRQHGGVIEEWRPGTDGRYHTSVLGISLQPDGALLRIFDPQGNPVPYPHENAHAARNLRQEMAALRAELERLRGERAL
jgi:Uma2 family endonuclease